MDKNQVKYVLDNLNIAVMSDFDKLTSKDNNLIKKLCGLMGLKPKRTDKFPVVIKLIKKKGYPLLKDILLDRQPIEKTQSAPLISRVSSTPMAILEIIKMVFKTMFNTTPTGTYIEGVLPISRGVLTSWADYMREVNSNWDTIGQQITKPYYAKVKITPIGLMANEGNGNKIPFIRSVKEHLSATEKPTVPDYKNTDDYKEYQEYQKFLKWQKNNG